MLVLSSLLLAACISGGNDGGGASSTPAPTATQAPEKVVPEGYYKSVDGQIYRSDFDFPMLIELGSPRDKQLNAQEGTALDETGPGISIQAQSTR